MAAQKEPLGFRTPAKRLEQAFEEIQRQLCKTRADWVFIARGMADAYEIVQKSTEREMTSPNRVMLTVSLSLAMMVAKLGVELTETHDRLAKVERGIKELKLAL